MSEKGQGEELIEGTGVGTGVGVDGTPAAAAAAGGGSQADQSGPGDDPLGGLTPSDFPAPPTPEEPEPAEKELPVDGPTDTRAGHDYPPGHDGPRGDPPEWQGPEQETSGPSVDDLQSGADQPADAPKPTQEEIDAAEERRQRGYDDAMRRRDEQRAREEGPPIEPPDLTPDQPEGSGEKPVGSYLGDQEKPVIT